MKRGSTLFLKIAVILIGIPVLACAYYLLPQIANVDLSSSKLFPDLALYGICILIVMYVSAIPFYFALYQAFKLLSYIDKNKAFSQLSVKALKNIKYCAITISGLYVVGLPLFFIIAEKDDAPGRDISRIGYYFCFNGDCSLCCCSSKAFTRSH